MDQGSNTGAAPFPDVPGPDDQGGTRIIPMDEVCRRLQIAPRTMRQILETHGAHLQVEEGDQGRGMRPAAVERARHIVTLRNQGMPAEDVTRLLEDGGLTEAAVAAAAGGPGTDEAPTEVTLSDIMARLEALEDRHEKDRDQVMVTLMKIQQEIQHLRYELASRSSRSDRKGGWFRGFFGS